MGKNIFCILAGLFLSLSAFAQSFTVEGINYNITSDSTVEVTSGGSYSGDITIPYSVGYNDRQYTVTSIGNSAFYRCSGLISITLSDGVTSIEYGAFCACDHLSSITFPDGLTSIGNFAFQTCLSLTSITLPIGLTSIGDGTFAYCNYLTAIDIPDGVTSIGNNAFCFCTNLTSITIPNGLTSIGDSAFWESRDLTSIKIPDGVTSIGDFVFHNCISLTSITIPDGVTSIGNGAFSYCSGLTSITIPDGVTSIGNSAFSGCSKFTSIKIPNGVTSIGSGAFSNCSGLTSITLPAGLTSIGRLAFNGCSSLTSITLPDGVTSIGDYAFSDCYNLKGNITLGDSLISIGTYAFQNSQFDIIICKSDIPPAISSTTFGYTPSSVIVPQSTFTAYKNAPVWSQYNILSEKRVVIENLTEGALASAIISQGYGPVSSITHLTVSGVLNGVDFQFMRENMNYLIELDISNVVLTGNTLPDYAFYDYNYMLSKILLPTSLERIGSAAFYNCNKLTEAKIPSSVKVISTSAFYECWNLSGKLILHEGLETIGNYAFSNCRKINGSLNIPSTVRSIGEEAFSNSGICGELVLPDSLKYLGRKAFYDCSSLTGILIIPVKIKNIASNSFSGCEQIEILVLHKDLISIGDAAFGNCKSLKKIVVQSSTPPTGFSNTFEGIPYDCHLSLPKNTAMSYLTSTLWGSFQKVSEIQREYEVMKGESVSLYGTTPIYPVENIRYVWEPGAGLSDSTVAYPVFKANTSRQYKLTVYSNDAVYDVDSVFVQVYPMEIYNANDKELLCGQSIQLDSIQTNYQGEGLLRYQWTPATGLNCDTIPNPVCSSLESISYTLTVTTPNDHSASDTVHVRVYNLPPNPVQGLRAENIDFDQIQLNWQKNDEADIAGYQVIRRSSVQAQDLEIVAMLDVDSIIDSLQIEEAREYSYLVYAIDYEGLKSDSAQISILSGDATAPDTVRNLSAQGLPDQIVLSWDPNTEHDMWKYRIYRQNEMDSLVLIAEVPLDTCSYTDNTVINEIVYYYAVTSIDSTDNSQWNPAYESPLSELVQAFALDMVPPAVPVLLEAQASNKRVELKWQAQSEPDLSLFRIYRSTDSLNFSVLDSVSGDTSLYTDTLVENFKSYYYCLSAVDTNRNESQASAVIKAEPFNLPPVITTFPDAVMHNQSDHYVPVYYDLSSSHDPDGGIVDYAWYVNNMNVRSTPVLNTEIPQGTNRLKAVVTDNDGAKDSVEFKVSIDGGYYTYESIEAQNAGITAIGMDLLFVPQAGGKMQVLNADLEPSFDVTISGEIQSVSSVSQDTVMYLSSSSKTIYCFDKRGISKWSLPLGGDLKATPTIDVYRNRIYVGVSNNNLFAIDRTSGQADWSYRTTSPISQPGVIIGRDHLLIITDNGNAHIFDLTKTPTDQILSPVGTINLNTTIRTAPAIDKEGFLYVSTTDGRLIKFYFDMNTYTGDILWNIPLGSSFETSPVIANNGNIYMGDTQGILYVINNSGQLLWQKDLGSAITSTITINEYGYYYVGTERGEMYAFIDRGQGFGEIIWHYASSSAISNATAFVNSCLLFSNRNGELFKIRELLIPTSTRAFPTEPQWGTYQGNYRRSGVQAETSGYTALPAVKTKPVVKQSPSPFSTDFQLEITLSATAPVNIQLMDIFGQIVHFEDLGVLNPGTHQRTIQASNWPAGVYLYQVRIGDGVYSEKIMKR